MQNRNKVESLFSGKAAKWDEKYSSDGPLHSRLAAFHEQLNELVHPPAQILDFGCGTGNLACHLAAHGYAVTACDNARKMIERAKEANPTAPINWHVLPVARRELPFASATFDGIVASSVFEYLPDMKTVLNECSRLLKPGGVLIATVPNPRNLIRRLEKAFRPIVIAMSWMPVLKRLPKLESYAVYLKCSCNRMSTDKWNAIAAEADFLPLGGRNRGTVHGGNNTPLVFIQFAKAK